MKKSMIISLKGDKCLPVFNKLLSMLTGNPQRPGR